MVTPDWPLKVSGSSVPGWSDGPAALTPIVAAPIASRRPPKNFEMRTRTASPPTPTVTRSRTVTSDATPFPQAMPEPQATRHTGVEGGTTEVVVPGTRGWRWFRAAGLEPPKTTTAPTAMVPTPRITASDRRRRYDRGRR